MGFAVVGHTVEVMLVACVLDLEEVVKELVKHSRSL